MKNGTMIIPFFNKMIGMNRNCIAYLESFYKTAWKQINN